MTILTHIADRALNRPLLITPEKASVILGVLGGRIKVDASDLVPDASRFVGDSSERDASGKSVGYLPYRRTAEGVGVLTIAGSLVNRGAWIGANSGLVSYEGIKFQLAAMGADPKVRSVILDLSSPGGEAVGAFEAAQAVRELAMKKQVVAVVNGMAASAAYAIASGATEIVTTETGVSGSIGVVLLHADYSAQLAEDGVKPTLIFAGAHKVDGNPFEPLTDAVRADLQAEVNAFYEKFLATVESGRGTRTTAALARKTEARTFIGIDAVKAGLADRVGTFESVLSELTKSARSSGRSVQLSTGGKPMSSTEEQGVPKATHDAAVVAARAEGEVAGANAERTRLTTILGNEKIKGNAARMTAAFDLAAKAPGMSADDVVAFVDGNVAAALDSQPSGQRYASNPANGLAASIPPGNAPEKKAESKIDARGIYAARRAAT